MRYVAAYLLAALGGNANPSAADVKNILSSVGIDAEEEKLNKVISEMNVCLGARRRCALSLCFSPFPLSSS